MSEVVIIGDAFVDIFCFCTKLPVLGGDTLLEKPLKTYPGGSGINTATHLVALINNNNKYNGAPCNVELHTVFSDDDHGRILERHAELHGFEIRNCLSNIGINEASSAQTTNDERKTNTSLATGHCIVIVAEDDRSFLTHRGCIDQFTSESVVVDLPPAPLPASITKRAPNTCKKISCQHLHIAGYFNIKKFLDGSLKKKIIAMKAEREEQNIHTTVSLVPQFDASGKWDGGLLDLLSCVDILIMSEAEALSITKCDNLSGAAHVLDDASPDTVAVVTRSSQGAVVLKNRAQILVQNAASVELVDPTGAGDAFAAGFIFGVLDRWPQYSENKRIPVDVMKQGLKWGCAVGSANVMTTGASNPSKKITIDKCYIHQEQADMGELISVSDNQSKV